MEKKTSKEITKKFALGLLFRGRVEEGGKEGLEWAHYHKGRGFLGGGWGRTYLRKKKNETNQKGEKIKGKN